VNALTQAVLPVLLAHADTFARQAAAIRSERARLAAALARLRGVRVFASQTNFVLVRVPAADAWFAADNERSAVIREFRDHPI